MMEDELGEGFERSGQALNAEILWLLGQPTLEDYLNFVRDEVIGGKNIPSRTLTDEWRAANDLYYDLERSEAGDADFAECLPLEQALRPLADELRCNPFFKATFDTVPATIEMVELDRLIVSQTHVASIFAEGRATALGPSPTPEALFRFCLPLERKNPPVRVQRLASDRYLFSSTSTDLRGHEPAMLDGEQLGNISSYGPIAGVIGLIVGFGSNFLTAIRSDKRLVLHNGYHRAYALRALGISHAPCIVQTVTRTDELRVVASEAVSDHPEFYFRAARPPMLRDFFNPALVKRLKVRRREKVVEVEFKMRTWTSIDQAG